MGDRIATWRMGLLCDIVCQSLLGMIYSPTWLMGSGRTGLLGGSGVTLQHLMLGVLGLKRRRSASIGQINCKDRKYLD